MADKLSSPLRLRRVRQAAAIDAFGRWDLAHLHSFDLADDTLLIGPRDIWDDPPQGRPVQRTEQTKLSRLGLGDQSPTPSTSATTGPTCARRRGAG